ncbi:hypothetical protein ACS0TY_029509 [Phlomoides rotata]
MHNSLADLAIISACGVNGCPQRTPTVKCVRWQLPPVGVLKINIDGSVVGSPGHLTGGGIFRDHFGMLRGCFAVSHGCSYAFEAELATAFCAIELAYDKGWSNIWLESDSTYVVHILKSSSPEIPWRLLARWYQVRWLRPNLHMVVSHIFREGNAVADRLSRKEVDRFIRAPFSLTAGFVPKEGFPVARFLMGPRPLDSSNGRGQSVSKHFHSILQSILKLHSLLLTEPQPVPKDSTDLRWGCFKDCLGALDGNYYLCDNGYPKCEGFLTPYKGVRYHLSEWSSRHPQNYQEYLNMKHTRA